MMDAAAAGTDRQEAHERIRRHTLEAARRMIEGAEGDLFERIAADDTLGVSASELEEMARPEKLVGRAPEQVDDFLDAHVAPVLERYRDAAPQAAEVRV